MGTKAAIPTQKAALDNAPTKKATPKRGAVAADPDEYRPDGSLKGMYYPLAGSTSGSMLDPPVAGMTDKEVGHRLPTCS